VLHVAHHRLAVFAAQSNGASKSSPYVSNPYADELRETAKSISNRGRGILASDESNVTTGKRLASVGELNPIGSACCYAWIENELRARLVSALMHHATCYISSAFCQQHGSSCTKWCQTVSSASEHLLLCTHVQPHMQHSVTHSDT